VAVVIAPYGAFMRYQSIVRNRRLKWLNEDRSFCIEVSMAHILTTIPLAK
jgi:hypothetical protein